MATVGLLLFPGTEELDLVGPYEVFAAAAALRPGGVVVTVGEHAGPARGAKGLEMVPSHTYATCPPLDLILVPGGDGRRKQMAHPPTLDFLRAQAASASWVTSVCTGAFVLVGAGLATGRRMTTHHSRLDELAEHPVQVVRGARFVVDGRVVSSAGVSAGIDMALWLVAQMEGRAFAEEVRHYIEYDHALVEPA